MDASFLYLFHVLSSLWLVHCVYHPTFIGSSILKDINCVPHEFKEIIMNNYVNLNNHVSSHSSFPFLRKTNKRERITENKYQTGEFKNWLVLVCCKWEVFFLPPTGSDLQCSASLLLRRFSQISESCFSSEPAGRQQSVESICSSSLAVSVIIDNIDLSLFSYFLDFWGWKSAAAAASPPLETKQAAPQHWQPFRDLFPLHPLLLLPQCCVSMDCVCTFLTDGLDCSSGFHWEQIGLWRQQQQQLNTTTTVTSIEKITVGWPVIAKRRLLPVPLLLCYRRG